MEEIKSEITRTEDYCYVVEPHHTLMDIARWLIKLTDSSEMKYCLDKAEKEEDSMDTMDFGDALAALKAGSRVAREGWNGKGMWLHLVTPDNSIPLGYPIQPYIAMKTADDKMQPGWLASQADMLAEDWVLV